MAARMLQLLEYLSDVVNIASKVLLIVIMTAMVTFTGLQVFCRYVFNAALGWPEEMNIFFMAWLTFVGSSIALKQSAHIGVDLFINFLPDKPRRLILLLGHLTMFAFIVLLIETGWNVACMNTDSYSEALELPLVYPRLSLVIGGAMMLLQMVYIVSRDIEGLCRKEEGAS